MRKPYRKDWDGNSIKVKGRLAMSVKIDGVCGVIDRDRGMIVSRAGKPLMHTGLIYQAFAKSNIERGEIFLGSYEKTMSRIKSNDGDDIPAEYFYPHTPLDVIDSRLFIQMYRDGAELSASEISHIHRVYAQRGDEGLVLMNEESSIIKVKDRPTYDLEVIGYEIGSGRNQDRLGALLTHKGKVGVGFTDEERELFIKETPKLIEVSAMGLTKNGNLRQPVFVRVRDDK